MKSVQLILIILVLLCCHYENLQSQFVSKNSVLSRSKDAVIIEVVLDYVDLKDSVEIKFSPVEIVGKPREWTSVKEKQKNGIVRWIIDAQKPMYFSVKSIFKNQKDKWLLIEPGDEVKIISNEEQLHFSGKGARKIQLQYKIDSIIATIPKPKNTKDYVTVSLEDYLEWHSYLNKHLELIIPLIDSYKDEISSFTYNNMKADFIDQNIDDRSDKFATFVWGYAKNAGITNQSICDIYDSTYYPATFKWFKFTSAHVFGSWKPIMFQIDRSYSFDYKSDPLNSSLKKKLLYYEAGLEIYKGLAREKFILDVLPEEFMQKIGFIPETEKLLTRYYAESGYPEYKQYVKELEVKQRELLNEKNASSFMLTDSIGQSFTKEQLKGKIAILDFWFTGCAGCVQMTPALRKVEEVFKSDTNVVFISISIDKDKGQWIKSIAQKKYTTGNGINLYTGGEGKDHPMIKQYAIHGYPALHLIDPLGRLIRIYPKPDPRYDNSKSLIELIQKQLLYMKDGPYVFHKNSISTIYSINGISLSTRQFTTSDIPYLPVHTDRKGTFNISVKKDSKVEPSEFVKPKKLFVLSDIEGNFSAFRKLLQTNKVIDEDFNWIFGDGHLVFAGDMFDRGQQVTECLWLVYSLEDKAKAAGGYVHFILGNHEIMNLQGNHRYVQQKYKNNAESIGKTLKELYNEDSELGRWLRTKNIMERIGDLLFVHGGIGNEFTDSVSLSISGVNDLARAYLDSAKVSKNNERNVRFIFSSNYSPFWFRQYYENEDKKLWLVSDTSVKLTIQHPNSNELDRILDKWKASKIITGHTIVADTISVHYGGKVINTDTKHAIGKSEALLIEGDCYYRVNAEGEKIILFSDLSKGANYTVTD